MVLAWYMDDSAEDPRLEHHLNPPQEVPIKNISFLTRVEIYRINVDDLDKDDTFLKLKLKNKYIYQDICEISREKLSDYDEMIKMFYAEHLHDDDEIRLFLDGSGYFDVRDMFDKWIRIKAEKGDLLILPAGIYHRFTPDTMNYSKVMRLFTGQPVWNAVFRPTEGEQREEIERKINERDSRVYHLNALGKNTLQVLRKEIENKEIF